jgi:hypothetical protein
VRSIHLDVVSPEEYRAWFDRTHDRLHRRSAFHHPAWLLVVERGLGTEVVFIGGYEGEELVLVVPGCLSQRGPLRLFGSHLRGTMTSYLGPVGLGSRLSDDEVPDLLGACCNFARERWGRDYVEFTLAQAPAGDEPVPGPGWEGETPGSYRLDLAAGEDALWRGLRSSCRRAIRKAQRLELVIVPLDDAEIYYRMLDTTFARHGSVSPHPKQFFRVMMEELIPIDLLWAWGVEYEGRVIAAALFLHDDREAHYLSGASLLPEAYRSLRANNLLHWHAITRAAREGLRVYDFGGRGIPSIDRFKETFGPEPVDYWSVSWARWPVRYAKRAFLAALPHWRRLRRWMRRGG